MALTFSGRVEAAATVPTGGASVSAQIANGGSAATVTVPAGTYFLTDAGAISGLVATLQTQLNATAALHGFPRTAAVMDTVVGGDWTNGSGWLCQEASGDLAPVFGAVTLADSGTPTYQNDGIKDGDYAVGISTTSDAFSGGDTNDLTDDLIYAWVGRVDELPAASEGWMSKAAVGGYYIFRRANGSLVWVINDSVQTETGSGNMPLGEWHVGMAVAERATNRMRIAVQGLTSGTAHVSSEADISAIGSLNNASSFLIGNGIVAGNTRLKISAAYIVTGSGVATGLSAGLSAALTNFANAINAAWSVTLSDTTGQVTIDWTGYATPTHSLSWTSTVLRDVLGFTANISGAVSATTGAKQARGLWFPDCPLSVADSDPRMAPVGSDARTSVTATGARITHVGNYHRYHRSVVWSHVPVDRIREQDAALANASFRTFWDDTQLARGLSWFVPGSSLLIVDHSGSVLGEDMQDGGPTEGWGVVSPRLVEPKRVHQGGWTGLWRVELPFLIAKDE